MFGWPCELYSNGSVFILHIDELRDDALLILLLPGSISTAFGVNFGVIFFRGEGVGAEDTDRRVGNKSSARLFLRLLRAVTGLCCSSLFETVLTGILGRSMR